MSRIAVIGAGAAGLIAARRAAQLGCDVDVYEAADRIGGMITPATLNSAAPGRDEFTIDIGAEAFALRGGAVRALIDELGLGDDVVAPRALGSWGFNDGRAFPMPAGGLMGIPSDANAAGLAEALTPEGFEAVRAEPTLDASIGADAVTLADFVGLRYGEEVLERLVAPVSRGVYSIDPTEVALDQVLPGIVDDLQRFGSVSAAIKSRRTNSTPGALVNTIRGGMNRMIAALKADCDRLDVRTHLGARIQSLDEIEADALVVTVAPSPAFPWLASLTDADLALAGETVPTEVVALVVDAPELNAFPRGTGVLVSQSNTVRAKALTHATAKWEWLEAAAGRGRHVLRCSYGPATTESAIQPQPATMRDPEVAALALTDASEILGVTLTASHLRELRRIVWQMPTPPTKLGRAALLARMRAAVAEEPRVVACGTWIDGTGLANVVPAAVTAAERAVAAANGA